MAWLYRTPPRARTPPHPSAHGGTRTDKQYIVCSNRWTEVAAGGDR